MSEELEIEDKFYTHIPENILQWGKKLNEQNDFVKIAIESLLKTDEHLLNMMEKYHNEHFVYSNSKPDSFKNYFFEHYTGFDLFDVLSYPNDFKGNELPAIDKLKPLGIAGYINNDEIHVFNKEYIKEQIDKYSFDDDFKKAEYKHYGIDMDESMSEDLKDQDYKEQQLEKLEKHFEEYLPTDRQLETAQKTGYVQGVCESVLAFNTDENRKIMSEATMTFLSKKLLSEMNVTKDMALKFANPETYKALEQTVFAPKQQEQHLEQTQSQGRSM